MIEKRILQVVVALACVVPLVTGGVSVLQGPGWLQGVPDPAPVDLDSHFRYISGIFLALGIGFASCIPRLEAMGPRFRLLGFMVVMGGLARLWSLLDAGTPSQGHLFGLGMELVVVPLIVLWREGMERRYRAGSSAGPRSIEGR